MVLQKKSQFIALVILSLCSAHSVLAKEVRCRISHVRGENAGAVVELDVEGTYVIRVSKTSPNKFEGEFTSSASTKTTELTSAKLAPNEQFALRGREEQKADDGTTVAITTEVSIKEDSSLTISNHATLSDGTIANEIITGTSCEFIQK